MVTMYDVILPSITRIYTSFILRVVGTISVVIVAIALLIYGIVTYIRAHKNKGTHKK